MSFPDADVFAQFHQLAADLHAEIAAATRAAESLAAMAESVAADLQELTTDSNDARVKEVLKATLKERRKPRSRNS